MGAINWSGAEQFNEEFIKTRRITKKEDILVPIILCAILCMFLLLLVPCSAVANNALPSEDEIYTWWKSENRKSPDEKLQINRIIPVHLKSKEDAFLAAVTFVDRGRNFFSGALLVRPNVREAREADGIGEAFEVLDIDEDGISEVSTQTVGSGQGTTSGKKSLVYFDGWKTVVIFENNFGDNLGECGSIFHHACYAKAVQWFFIDLDGDEKSDLVETVVIREGKEANKLKWSVSTQGYLLKAKKLIKTAPTLRTKAAKATK